jgi:hypothetical protein
MLINEESRKEKPKISIWSEELLDTLDLVWRKVMGKTCIGKKNEDGFWVCEKKNL